MSITLDDIVIRTSLQPGDIGLVTWMHGKIYQQETGYGLQFESYVAGGLHEFVEQFNPTNNAVWIGEHKGKLIGFLALMNRGEWAQLRYFIIDPAYRGIGLGRKLMDLYVAFLNKSGYTKSYLMTTGELPTAAHLYTSYGFKLVHSEPTIGVFGKKVEEQRYELRLS